MAPTRFFLIRHAIVTEQARQVLYGRMDVPICADQLRQDAALLAALARALPGDAQHVVTPLSRTRATLAAIRPAAAGTAREEPGLTEQDLGDWQGLAHADLPARLRQPAHPFWPLAAYETPPGGESMQAVVARVGGTLERLAAEHEGGAVVAVSHGGAIRAALAHALGIDAHAALHFGIANLSLTRLERHGEGWRVVGVNETPQP